MELVKTIKRDTYGTVEIYRVARGFEVFCMIGDGLLSRSFPAKVFKTEGGANRYGNRFLGA